MSEEDVIPFTYPYAWSPESDLSLDNFLNKYRPSMVQNDGTKPWIWVMGLKLFTKDEKMDEANKEASRLLREVTANVEAIQTDPTIPTRASTKTGAKSKKQRREQVQSEATEKLKEIAIRNDYVSGKWLIFASSEKVDKIWSSLAISLVSGPLAATPAFLAKVATSPKEESSNHQHLICIYMPDVFEMVMKVILRHHGVNLSGVKSDMYTSIGIYSKHPSGILPTVWKNSDLLSDAEAKELKYMYWAEVTSTSKATEVNEHLKTAVSDDASAASAKPKPKPKKKKVNDDPFASDNDDQREENQRREIQSKVAATQFKRQDIDDDEVEDRPNKKKFRML
ncbi:hypothetical protein L208DRAFT_1439551 [Tricholoma matsutake]|nr:hypothetical protein L208DRAFT_1439551 [Tricholoma matsutake 945]